MLGFCRYRLLATTLFRLSLSSPIRRNWGIEKGGSSSVAYMSNKPAQAVVLKHLRRKDPSGVGSKLKPPSSISVQVLGNGASGSSQSLVLIADASRYLFNCGEGTQRLCHENKVKYVRLENIFITHKSWKNVGGLLGMALSLQEATVPRIAIYGPKGVDAVFAESRKFAPLTRLSVECRNASDFPFVDEVMKVDLVQLYNSSNPDDVAFGYICKFHDGDRKLDLERAVELDLPRGPWIGKLKNGETITLEDGRTITPEDVLMPHESTHMFVVIECPTAHHVDSLLASPTMNAALADSADGSIGLIAHMTPPEVLAQPTYQSWMERFPKSCQHFIFNRENKGVSFEALHRLQVKLNLIDSDIFPLLPQLVEYDADATYFQPSAEPVNIRKAYTNMKFHLRPAALQNCESECVVLSKEAYLAEIEDHSKLDEQIQAIKVVCEKSLLQLGTPVRQYPEMVLLGTGSSIPNKERNVSSILLHVNDKSCMLFDCGEDTYGQIFRNYGDQGALEVLQHLRCVFISHMHADHHMGLLAILEARRMAIAAAAAAAGHEGAEPAAPLYVLGPRKMRWWLDLCQQNFNESLLSMRFLSLHDMIQCQTGQEQFSALDAVAHEALLAMLDLSELKPVAVIHANSFNAFGICVSHRDGWKIVYSGDTMPCDALVDAGRGCDLLVHEATMEDDMSDLARIKTHSTTSQAIEIGKKMQAKFTLLTHFSQRYAKVPIITELFTDTVGIAFDNMRVRLDTVHRLGHFRPALQTIFAESCAEMEERSVKRKIQRLRSEGLEPEAILKKMKAGKAE